MVKEIVLCIVLSFVMFLVFMVDCNINTTDFIHCMATQSPNSTRHIYNKYSPEFLPLFQTTQQVSRWINSSTSSFPDFIITPYNETEIQAAVICTKMHQLELRIKSGGHDYEGLSYRSQNNYIIIDMVQLRQILVDVTNKIAWVQAGATLGELYYAIAQKSHVLAFPGGTCPSVGTGGFLSGGGFGWLFRKYGLGADNVLDARIVDAYGRVLDRGSMGEDFFWAIRGGGGASFGIIASWKLKLVSVPPTVTAFTKHKYLNESATELVYQWQNIAPKLPNNLVIRVMVSVLVRGQERVIRVGFNSIFQGSKAQLMGIMNESFPALGLMESDCFEMPWINSSILYWGRIKGNEYPLENILNRTDKFRNPYKGKSDFVTSPVIPQTAFQDIWELFLKIKRFPVMILEPFGGIMEELSPSSLPFPYRNGTLYNIQYLIRWQREDTDQGKAQIRWMNELYEYMTPFVTHSPRSAYLNYRDLDLGMNPPQGPISISLAKVWGVKYYGFNNFERLCRVKNQVDPDNFFRHEQSIPPLKV